MAYTPPTSGWTYSFSGTYTPPTSGWAFEFTAEGGGPQYLFPSGWDSAEFGAQRAYTQQFITPSGFDASVFGTQALVLWTQYAIPAGFDTSEFGTPTLVEKFLRNHDWTTAYTAPAGDEILHNWSSSTTPILSPLGLDTAEFGTTDVRTPPSIRPAGIASTTAFGTATVYKQQFIVLSGMDVPEFGTTAVENQNRVLELAGFETPEWGDAVLTRVNFPQTITTTGEDYARVGVQEVEKPQNIDLQWWGIQPLDLGIPDVSYFIRTVYPEAINGAVFGEATEISNYYRELPLAGFDSAAFGTALVRENHPYPEGFDAAAVGSHTVANFRQIIAPAGWDALWVSTNVNERHVVSNYTRYLPPAGIDAMVFGTTFVSNFIRYLSPAGIPPPSMTTGTWISFYIRYIAPIGRDFAAVWWDYGPLDPVTGRPPGVYNETGHVLASGIDAAAVGTPGLTRAGAGATDWTQRASFGDFRDVSSAGGFDTLEFGSTQVGGSVAAQAVTPTGFDSATFGTPMLQGAIQPAGFDSATFGTTQLDMTLVVTGFDTVVFGTPMLQGAIQPAGFDAAELGSVSLTSIVAPLGIDSAVFGATRFDMNVAPGGFDAQYIGTPAVGHRVAPSGFDSLTFEAYYVLDGYVADGYAVNYNHDVRNA